MFNHIEEGWNSLPEEVKQASEDAAQMVNKTDLYATDKVVDEETGEKVTLLWWSEVINQ